MRAGLGRILMACLAALMLTACSRNAPRLLNMASTADGPDEFAILPNKQLEMPGSVNDLPAPTPGGANLVDPTPYQDAAVALGGRASAVTRSGIPAADAPLVRQAGRYGVSANIRAQLAAEDLDVRRRKNGRILERLFHVNVYFRAYRNQILDKYAELERFRKLGVRTPAAPPDVKATPPAN